MARPARAFKKDTVAWAVALVGGVVVVAGSHMWMHRRVVEPGHFIADSVEEPQIVALAFDRVVEADDGRNLSAVRLRSHLEALRDDGFEPVTLRALTAFFVGEARLPAKSLLLSFDHGYLSTYAAADAVLREMGWNAALFIATGNLDARDPNFVYWDRVGRMTASGVWEIGSHGHRSEDTVVMDQAGRTEPFAESVRWLVDSSRSETVEELARRLSADHEQAKRLMEGYGIQLFAYAPPRRIASESDEIHRAVETAYQLAFYDDRFGINDRLSDPLHLKRLRVDPKWRTEELVARLRLALDEPVDTGLRASSRSLPWIAGSGDAHTESGEMVVTDPSGRPRVDVWRAGSQGKEDWELELEVCVPEGELWVVQESAQGRETWRFGGTARRTYVQTRGVAEKPRVLASFARGIEPGRWHRLRVVKRGLGVAVWMDGELLGGLPTFLPGRWRGSVGLVHWNPEGEPLLRVRRRRFSVLPFELSVVSSDLPREQVQAAVADFSNLAAFSPKLFELTEEGLLRAPFDETLAAMLSHRFGWEIVPTVKISAVDPSRLEELLAVIETEAFSGLRVELSQLPVSVRVPVRDLLIEHARRQRWKQGRLIVYPPAVPQTTRRMLP